MKIIIHLGAHKTGSSAIQQGLSEASVGEGNFFLKDGVYVDLRSSDPICTRIRSNWGQSYKSDSRKQVSTDIRNALQETHRQNPDKNLIISYENLCGDYNLSGKTTIYPLLARYVQVLYDATRDYSVTYVFGVRNYWRFIESTHSQLVKGRYETRSFFEYYQQVPIDALSWLSCYEAIAGVVGEKNTLFYRYEDFLSNPNSYLEQLFGLAAKEENARLPLANPSLSAKGVELLRRLNPVLSPEEKRKVRAFLSRNFATSEECPSYNPFRILEQKMFTQKYEDDCKAIPLFVAK